MKNWKIYLSMLFLILASILYFSDDGQSLAEEKNQEKPLKIGVSLYRGDDEFISSIRHALEEEKLALEKETNRKMTVKILDSKNSQSIQNSQIDQLVRSDYDVIAVNVVDRTVASNIIYKARQAGIPLIFFNREPIQTDLIQWNQAYYIGSKAQESGEMQGELVLEQYRLAPETIDLNRDGKIQYVMLEGEEVHQDSLIRTESSIKTIVEGGVKVERLARGVGNWMRQPSKEFVREWLEKYPNQIELVMSNNDEMAIGAIEALREIPEGMTLPHVVGIDGTSEGLEAVDRGEMLGTVRSDPNEYAREMLTLAKQLVESNEQPIGNGDPYIWIPHQLYQK
ncbi:galactose ABC transporter substrate-binding protein [Enterococcus alcedinis]|uniref:D-galactose/methyl-galactoside binding periplasmic protein MglB n=1 Tax=Enterococcus alcedinis TaxID=1274384 RepID=A0A917JHC1_9ENTE|nr:galactose ABC transporter substrate-binding protein [Enterococcus alcedinis]MBP2102165.1 methyl-galactoside transport system substrate-binding protein [Enterococcus alcedinis]GGI65726.1 galactose ABC transporter substrate-binding protein [Enterococcus alcedinis]